LVPGSVGALGDLLAYPEHVVVGPVEQRLDHLGQGRGVVGVVAVDGHVDVGLDVGEGPADDVALALGVLVAHDRAGVAGDLVGAIGAVVVVDVDDHLGDRRAQVLHNLADGDRLVVTRDDRSDGGRRHGNLWSVDWRSEV